MNIIFIIVAIIFIIVIFLLIYNHLYPTFPNYQTQPYQFLSESLARPRQFERWCKNMNMRPEDARKEAREIFDALPIEDKIEIWEILDAKTKTNIESQMTDAQKELLRKHKEEVEFRRTIQMTTALASRAFNNNGYH